MPKSRFRRYIARTLRVVWPKHKEVFSELFDHLHAEHRQAFGPSCRTRDQSDAYIYEIKMLEHMGTVQLAARIQALRRNLRDMMVSDEFSDLMRSIAKVTSDKTTCLTLMRWEARALLDRVYRRYVLVPAVEVLRSRITRKLLRRVGVFLFLLLLAIGLNTQLSPPLLGFASIAYLSAALAGSMGAAISTLIRLNRVDPRRDPLMTWLSLERGSSTLTLSPFLGAVFGVLFLLIMRAGVVTGTLFPDFTGSAWRMNGELQCLVRRTCPELHRDFAAILIWCFAAGWIERLVPDVLNRMAGYARAQADNQLDGPA